MILLLLSGCSRYIRPKQDFDASTISLSSDQIREVENERKSDLKLLITYRTSILGNDVSKPHKLSKNDVISLSVYDLPDINGDYRLDQDNSISIPLLGNIKIGGYDIYEGSKIIGNALVKKGLKSFPLVRLNIVENNSDTYNLFGSVTKPGVYPINKQGLTIAEAIGFGGGQTKEGSRWIKLIRTSGNNFPSEQREYYTDLLEDLGGSLRSSDIPIMSGDTIMILEKGNIFVDGEVEKPASYPLSENMTVYAGLIAAGGPKYSGYVEAVELIREIEHGKKLITVINLEESVIANAQDILLLPGDIIRVPSNPHRYRKARVGNLLENIFGRIFLGINAK